MSTKKLFELADRFEKQANMNFISPEEALKGATAELEIIRKLIVKTAQDAIDSRESADEILEKILKHLPRFGDMLEHSIFKLNNIEALIKHDRAKQKIEIE